MMTQFQLAAAVLLASNLALAATPVEKSVTPEQFAKIAATHPSLILGTNEKTTKDPVDFDLTLKSATVKTSADPATLFASIRAQAPKHRYVSEQFVLDESYGLLTATENYPGAKPSAVFDLEKDVVGNEADPTQTDVGMYGYFDQQYQVLSIVGSIVSYRVRGDYYGAGAAHPDNVDIVAAVDLTQQEDGNYKEANLLSLVEENSLVLALQNDKALNSKLGAKYRTQLKRARNMQEAGDAINNGLMAGDTCYDFGFYDGKLSNFAIFDYDAAKNVVQVRVTMGAGAHVCAAIAPTIQLGLALKPRQDLQQSLEAQAKRASGLLMKNVK